jgi:hypothetical protein
LFNIDSTTQQVLQFGTWNIASSLAYVQSWRVYFNLEDHGQANYPLWIEFLALPADLRPFEDLFANHFGKVLIPEGKCISFRTNPRVCVEVDLKKKLPPFIYVMTIDGVQQ